MTATSDPTRRRWLAAALVALLCVVCFGIDLELPLVRNGFVYARAAENVVAHGYDPRPVVADSLLSYDKPIGFAWISAPFVAALGNHAGLRVVSLLGTLAYLVAVWRLLRAFDPFGFDERERTWAFLFASLSPLVVYQSWSAHPDSLFAAVYLSVFTLTVRIVERPSAARVAAWSALILVAVLLKNYGMILLPSAGVFLLWNARRLWTAPGGRRGIAWLACAFALLGVVVALGWLGGNPLMRFEGEGGGVGQYGKGRFWIAARGTLVQLGFAIAVNLHVALVPALARASFDRRLVAALASFPIPYVLGLTAFPTTFYNMRYFVPVLPFVAIVAVHGLRSGPSLVRRLVPRAFVVTALALIALFNVAPLYERFGSFVPRLEVNWIGVPLSLLDNLRMPIHLEEKAWIDRLNATVEPDAVVYFLDVGYYRDARHGVYERGGLIRRDVRTRYASSQGFAPTEPHFWVRGPVRDRRVLERLGTVVDRGDGLFEMTAGR